MTRVFSFLLCGAIFISNGAHATEQEQLENLRSRINALKKEFDKTNESKSEASDALRESELSISNSNRKLNDLAEQQSLATGTLARLHQQSKQLERNIRDEQSLLSKLLYQQYLGGKQEYLKLLLNNHDPNQVARELQYYDYIARSRATWLKTMRDNLTKLQEVANLTRDKTIEIGELQKEERSQRNTLNNEKKIREQTLAKVAQQLKLQRREMGRLQRDENRLSLLVEKLAKMLSRQQVTNLPRNEILPNSNFDGKLFQHLKGKLSLPVKGQITNKFGSLRPDSTVQWKGLFLRASASQPVRAVATGRVVFADWLRGFGNLIIIDHGKGYMSLYGYNESIFKLVGDSVKGGESISSVGNSGGNEESGLYFELRHEGIPFDPIKWVTP